MSTLIGSVSLNDNQNGLYLGRVSIDGMNTNNKEILYMNGSDISGSNSFTYDYSNNRLNVVNVSGSNLTISNINGGAYTPMIYNSIQTSDFYAYDFNTYPVNTTSTAPGDFFTARLPASPVVGSVINFIDYSNNFINVRFVLYLNGNKFNGLESLIVVYSSISICYIDSSQGWTLLYGNAKPLYYKIKTLIVAGGGGAKSDRSGGGGGGGVLYDPNAEVTNGVVYNARVGAGGSSGLNGSNSILTIDVSGMFNMVAFGGGYGGTIGQNGNSGGSGGGAGANTHINTFGGSGYGFQGSLGANGSNVGDSYRGAGGGGGVYGVTPGTRVNGVIGTVNPIPGSTAGVLSGGSYYLAGGGGAGSATWDRPGPGAGLGGLGGGGNGGSTYSSGANGLANTGGGGGGCGGGGGSASSGGSGVIVLSIPITYYSGIYTGTPTITTYGANKILTFTSNGSYTA
jgi:hypothetical protein